jgi:hypothetical protein
MLQLAFWYYLLFAPHILLIGVLILLCSRRYYSEYPLFFAYVIYEHIQFPIALYLIFANSISLDRYWRLNAILTVGSVFFRFGVIYELYSHLSKNYPSLEKFCKFLFRGLSAVLLFISVALVALVWPGHTHELTRFVTYILDRAVNMLQLGLLFGLFGIAKFFGVHWRKHIFGITFGFALYLSVQLIATAVQAQWGYLNIFDYITMAAYHVSVVVWLVYLLVPEEATDHTIGPKLQAMPEHADIAAWNNELERLLHNK